MKFYLYSQQHSAGSPSSFSSFILSLSSAINFHIKYCMLQPLVYFFYWVAIKMDFQYTHNNIKLICMSNSTILTKGSRKSYFFSCPATKALSPPSPELGGHIFSEFFCLASKKVLFYDPAPDARYRINPPRINY